MPAASRSGGALGACAVVVRLVGFVAVGVFNLAAQGVLQGFLRETNLYAETSVIDPKEPAHRAEDLNRLLIHPKPARVPEAMSSGRRKHETYQKRLVAVHQHGVSCIALLK
jgi:hypothetical protein